LRETGKLAVGVLAEEVVEEGAHDWTTSVTVTVGTIVPEIVIVMMSGGPAEAVAVAVDVYSVMLHGCQFENWVV
jgi:hypothetical protein